LKNDITEKALKKIKRKYKKKRFLFNLSVLIIILCIPCCLITIPVIARLFKNHANVYTSVMYLYIILIGYICYLLLILFIRTVSKGFKRTSLNSWIGSIGVDNPLEVYLHFENSRPLDLENLNIIKKKIITYCENDEENLRLLRSYYYTLINNNSLVAIQTIVGIFVVVVGYILKEILLDHQNLELFGANFDPFLIFFGVASLVIYIYNDMVSRKNKVFLIYKIIDEIIDCKSNK